MSMLQRFLSSTDRPIEEERVACEEIEEGQPHNPYSEILILQHHSDIVRLLLRIDDKRFVSAGDDSRAVIWEVQYGRRIATLTGHTHPITSLLLLRSTQENEPHFILSGSSDKQIRKWNADTGQCHNILNVGGSVRCLQILSDGLIISGGESLSLWSKNDELLHSMTNSADEDINLMIVVKNDRIVTAADRELVVYRASESEDVNQRQLVRIKQMNPHREAIQSLVPISTSSFASGSLDGMIIIWTVSNLQATRKLHVFEDYEGENKRFPYSVQAMLCLQERYLFAAIGCGLLAFDVNAEQETLIIQKKSTHWSKITRLGFACEGEFLVTCSEDKCMRLWGKKPTNCPSSDDIAVSTMTRFSGMQSHEISSLTSPWEPALLGECCAHGGSIQGYMDFDHEGIVTCGSDGLVIIWKNYEMQKVRRNQAIQKLFSSWDGIV